MARIICGWVLLLGGWWARGDVSRCACNPARPESLRARECALCLEAERQPANVEFFVLRDVNPRKPNRWLALPRAHGEGPHALHEMPKGKRDKLWAFAVRVAREKFGPEWGIAYNGWRARTQCHTHLHIGRFAKAAENSSFRLIRHLENLPAPRDGGMWVHPVAGGYHVHTGEQIVETVLVR